MKISKWDTFKTFFIIGLTTFGGGYGMLGVMKHKLVGDKKWLTDDEMMEILAVSESSPGPFAINAATCIGYKNHKFIGSVLATLAVVLPSLIISIIISILFKQFSENIVIINALKGISAGISAVILMAFLSLSKKQDFNLANLIIFLIAIFLVFFNILSIIYIILIGAVFGITVGYIKSRKEVKNDEHNNIDA